MKKSRNDLSARRLKKFLATEVAPLLGPSYRAFGRRALIRMRGVFLQAIILEVTRARILRVFPNIFVIGAHPDSPDIGESMSLYAIDDRKWSVIEPELNDKLAHHFVGQLDSQSPISFFDPLTDDAAETAIRFFVSRGNHWPAWQSFAFFNIVRGAETARIDLAQSTKFSRRQAWSDPPKDFQIKYQNWLAELNYRLDLDNCIALCRKDAEAHAERLNLPQIEWPPEWPTQVPPWPKKEPGLFKKLLG